MENIQEVYKVVRLSGSGSRKMSCNASALPSYCTYRVGQKAFPVIEHSYLYAFESLDLAHKFLANRMLFHATYEIYLAKAEVFDGPALIWNGLWFFGVQGAEYSLNSFWDAYAARSPKNYERAPKGTVLCHWIELQELVGRYHIDQNYIFQEVKI